MNSRQDKRESVSPKQECRPCVLSKGRAVPNNAGLNEADNADLRNVKGKGLKGHEKTKIIALVHDAFERMMQPFDPREEEEEQQESEEEARKAKIPSAPSRPSLKEIEEHMTTHLPFRSWCPHCVRGKAKGKQHRKQDREHHKIPTVAIDYAYMKLIT